MRQALEQKKSKGSTREKKRQTLWILKLLVLFGPPLTFGTLTYAKPRKSLHGAGTEFQNKGNPKGGVSRPFRDPLRPR